MNNLFSFGCSLTYGHGMDDNWDFDNNRPFDLLPSKKAWPFLLANMLNYNCVNLGQCGASNKEILYILEQNIDRISIDDLVVIKWSFADRIGFIDKSFPEFLRVGKNFKTHPQINHNGIGTNKKWLQWIEDFSTPEDNRWMSRIFIDYATLLLKQKSITAYHFYSCKDIRNLDYKFAKIENVDGMDRHALMKFPASPLCKNHPGEEAQYFLANTKFKLIEERT